MRKSFLIVAIGLLLAVFVTQIAVSPAAGAPQDDPVAAALTQVTRATQWQHVGTIDLQFDAEHPQGMVKLGDRFFISSVEIIEPTQPCPVPCDGYDRTPGRGVGHLFVVDAGGALLADVTLGEGHMYHPGGIDSTAGGCGCRSPSTGRTRMRSSIGSTPTALRSKRPSGSGTTSEAWCGTGWTVMSMA